jgi:hypothetical protein
MTGALETPSTAALALACRRKGAALLLRLLLLLRRLSATLTLASLLACLAFARLSTRALAFLTLAFALAGHRVDLHRSGLLLLLLLA